MKTILLLSISIFLTGNCLAQTNNELKYFIFTSYNDTYEGMIKDIRPLENVDITPTINYYLYSKSKKIILSFIHLNQKQEKLQMKILTKPAFFLYTITPVDLDKLLPTLTPELAEEFITSLIGKKIFLIDRNDITKDSVTLVETRIFHNRID